METNFLIIQKINKMNIQLKNCEGYIWKSDQQKPEVFNKQDCSVELNDNDNPFVIEGQLYSETEQKSYGIRYVDGRHIVVPTSLDDLKGRVFDEKTFLAHHRIDGVSELKFRQYWKKQIDPLCESMETLVPAEYVFVGFEFN